MKTLLLAIGLLFTAGAWAQSGYAPGDVARDFSLKNANNNLNGIDKAVSLADYADAKGVILIFTCNHCPFSVAYEDRIIDLHNKYAPLGYPVVAINPNDPVRQPQDSYDNMKVRAEEKAFPFAYLFDHTQEVALAYGAKRTPHVFVLRKEGSLHKVAFIGAIDDNAWNQQAISTHYVADAVDALLAGKAVTKTTAKAIGCTIKWKSE